MPPAELRAGDDPGVLIEEVAHVRIRSAADARRSRLRAGVRAAAAGSPSEAPPGAFGTVNAGGRWVGAVTFGAATLGAAFFGAAPSSARPWGQQARRGRSHRAEADGHDRRADVRRDVFRLTLLRVRGALERDGDRRGAGVLHARARGRESGVATCVGRKPVHAAETRQAKPVSSSVPLAKTNAWPVTSGTSSGGHRDGRRRAVRDRGQTLRRTDREGRAGEEQHEPDHRKARQAGGYPQSHGPSNRQNGSNSSPTTGKADRGIPRFRD